jgi:hypothetical protein
MKQIRWVMALVAGAAMVSGCYVVPVRGPDGAVLYQTYPLPPVGAPMPGAQVGPTSQVLSAKLYPANELAAQTGIVVGTVTNLMTGKGLFQVNYMGEVLNGEATRVSNSDRRGVASAYSSKGAYMSCEYQMNTPYQGAGTCTFSNGAKYQLHVGGS